MSIDDPLFFADDETADSAADERPAAEPWPVLVVDDDPQVHHMTSILLRDFEFEGRPFEMVKALSAADARAVLAERPDIPVALLDVVMETDDAGLRLVRHIREDLGNTRMRIILRTGQPGQAPERDVVVAYDINDYKSKSELTAQKLFTALIGALRSWRDIVTIERHRQGLERIVNATPALFETRSMRALVERLVEQFGRVVENKSGVGTGGAVVACRPSERGDGARALTVVAGSGRFAGLIGQPVEGSLPPALAAAVAEAFATQRSAFAAERCVLMFRTLEHGATVFAMERPEPYDADDHRLLELFCARVAIGFDNVCLYEDLVALNRSLEQRVGERTAELAANQKALVAAKERVERALERELEAKNQQRQFLTMVSHEFRTPLAVIDSAAQMLALRAEAVEPAMLERLGVIRTGVQRLTGLIDAYLTDERLQAGNLVLDRQRVDLADLVRATAEVFRAAHPECTFAVDVAGLPAVSGDDHLLGLVLANLIGNAVKYSHGTAQVRVRGSGDGPMAVLEVTDEGCGIPPNEVSRVFDRFFRGSNTADLPGTGIGLHTVQQIVQLHGGAITVDSATGVGSTFRMVLPVDARGR
jgi:signal transduction histidine kinase/DNA-binding NarL/FixJ family response regulator